MKLGSSVLKYLTEWLCGSAVVGSWPDPDLREELSRKRVLHKERREMVDSPRYQSKALNILRLKDSPDLDNELIG